MTLHKLSAGTGYEYLTRQVAALDATDKGHTGLSTYYSERGEAPGVWVGSGLAGLAGLEAGDPVTGVQMKNLFALGCHPLHDPKLARDRSPSGMRKYLATDWTMGQPHMLRRANFTPFQIEVAHRVAEVGDGTGEQVPAAVRAKIRTMVAIEFFGAEHSRLPNSERELHAFVAKNTRPMSERVSGYDLTFSPVKSVSTLWAVADPTTAATVERAHNAAVADALKFIETHALYTRTGASGIRQVETTGLVATAFTHRDSRAGDPDLHTHVAVANKVQTRTTDGTPGRWLAIDGRVLFKAKVAASETYNTRLEHHLTEALGVRFAERDTSPARARGAKRTVREIVGVDPALNAAWSKRRTQIVSRQSDLAAQFRVHHGRPPTPVEALHLAQQANLETRDKKHSARTITEQRDTWRAQALEVLGSPEQLDRMVQRTLSPSPTVTGERAVMIDQAWVENAAVRVIDELEQRRATWQTWHVRAEAQRQIRAADLPSGTFALGLFATPDDLVDQVTHTALTGHSVSLAGPRDEDYGVNEPAPLRRSDGTSVYTVAGAEQFSSSRIMAAERRLLQTATAPTMTPSPGRPMAVPTMFVRLAVLDAATTGTPLNPAQATLVHDMATSGKPLQLAIAPAGSGKTTALRALAMAWTEGGGNVLALAPSAAAAGAMTDVLGDIPRTHGDTLAKLTHTLNNHAAGSHDRALAWVGEVGPSTLVLIDEAGMADTLTLDQVVSYVTSRGGQVRLIGDDQQLAAIGAGGILRDIKQAAGAIHLDELMRFTNRREADATIALREGDHRALDFYETQDRVHIGDQHSIADTVHTAWRRDRAAGLDSLMVAPTRTQVADLNQRAQSTLFPNTDAQVGAAARATTPIGDGNRAGPGDLVITRTNDRRLRLGARDWVKNGDRWAITNLGDDGSMSVRHTKSGLTTRLPATYVTESVELGYATTIHTAQGTTVDTLHGLATGSETRQDLYTMLTRGRQTNHVYLTAGATDGDPHDLITPDAIHPRTAREMLEGILDRDGAATSATTQLQTAHDPKLLFQQATDRYADALTVACEDVVGAQRIAAIEDRATELIPTITEDPAWPTLRNRLIRLEADNHDAVGLLDQAAHLGKLTDAIDPSAVLEWRIDNLTTDQFRTDSGVIKTDAEAQAAGAINARTPVPQRLLEHPTWGEYLDTRQQLADSFEAWHRASTPDRDYDYDATATQRRPGPERAPTWTPDRPSEGLRR